MSAPSPLQVAEIFDIIVDHLHDNHKALAACSLVCRAWLPSSRYHLFFTVQVSDTGNLTRFLDELDSPLSTIAPFVRTLTLHECDYISPPKSTRDMETTSRTATSEIDARTVSLSRLVALKKLELHRFHFNHFNEFIDIVSVFPLLKEISLDVVQWEDDQALEEPNRGPPPALQVICLGQCDKGRILNWVTSEEVVPMVKIVNLRQIVPSQMSSIRRFLRIVGPSLEQLHLCFFNFDWAGSPGEPTPACNFRIWLTQCPNETVSLANDMMHASNLRSIQIEAYAYSSPSLEVWLSLLSQISSGQMEAVVFNIWAWRSLNESTWADMDRLFTSPRFVHLRKVCVQLLFLGGERKAANWVSQRLPRCAARGILSLWGTTLNH